MNDSDKPTVLIVDDDTFLLDMYSVKFKERGFTVRAASNAQEALTFLKEKNESPDAVLVDLVMPTMDGFELLEEIHKEKLCPNSAIIVFSNLGEVSDVERAEKIGIDDYFVKAGVTPSEALEKVEEVIKRKKAGK